MAEALDLANQAAALGEVPVGAVVVRGDQVLAGAFNRRALDADPTAHAELLAIRAAARELGDWRLEGCELFVTLEPCPMCAGAIVLSRLQRCVYGCADPKGGFLGSLGDLSQHPGLNHRFEVVPGLMGPECSELLRSFFAELRARRR